MFCKSRELIFDVWVWVIWFWKEISSIIDNFSLRGDSYIFCDKVIKRISGPGPWKFLFFQIVRIVNIAMIAMIAKIQNPIWKCDWILPFTNFYKLKSVIVIKKFQHQGLSKTFLASQNIYHHNFFSLLISRCPLHSICFIICILISVDLLALFNYRCQQLLVCE